MPLLLWRDRSHGGQELNLLAIVRDSKPQPCLVVDVLRFGGQHANAVRGTLQLIMISPWHFITRESLQFQLSKNG